MRQTKQLCFNFLFIYSHTRDYFAKSFSCIHLACNERTQTCLFTVVKSTILSLPLFGHSLAAKKCISILSRGEDNRDDTFYAQTHRTANVNSGNNISLPCFVKKCPLDVCIFSVLSWRLVFSLEKTVPML